MLEDGELEAGGPRAQAELALMLLFLGGLFAVEILLMEQIEFDMERSSLQSYFVLLFSRWDVGPRCRANGS